ncbi:MAG: hypothetical protein ACP5O0_02820 [Acidimicrobiales bacterium]
MRGHLVRERASASLGRVVRYTLLTFGIATVGVWKLDPGKSSSTTATTAVSPSSIPSSSSSTNSGVAPSSTAQVPTVSPSTQAPAAVSGGS